MGSSASQPELPRPMPRSGMTRLCIAGFPISHNTGLAVKTARVISARYPDSYETWFHFLGGGKYRDFIDGTIKPLLPTDQQEKFKDHRTAPFCWIETDDGNLDAKGGGDRFREWVLQTFPESESSNAEIRSLASRNPSLWSDGKFDKSPGTSPIE